LEEHIKAMTAQRLQDGELNECELTLRDLQTIERAFAHVLRGVLHHRIEYPDLSRALKDGSDSRDWTHDTLTDPLANARFAPAAEPEQAAMENRAERRVERNTEGRPAGLPDCRAQRATERNQKSEKVRNATKTALSSHLRHHGKPNTKDVSEKAAPRRTDEKPRPSATGKYTNGVQVTERSERENGSTVSYGRRATDAITPLDSEISREVGIAQEAKPDGRAAVSRAHHMDNSSRQSSGYTANGHTANGHAGNGQAVNGHIKKGARRNPVSGQGVAPSGVESNGAQGGANLPEARSVSHPNTVTPPE
jgi:hypothetical protein